MSYIGTEPKDIRSFGRTKFDYTASQGQTAFTGADDDGKVLAFTTGQINVYVNGILMDDSDFTTTGTGTVTLASAANLNDVVNIVSFESNIPDNDYVPASGGTFTGNITASGTLGVTGAVTASNGLTVDDAGATPLTVDRATSFGNIIDVQKDGASVGAVGSPYGGELYIQGTGANSSGLLFTSGNTIQPRKNSAADDGNIDIGASGNKFKDLYLGGGAYIGGTVAANKLDDYEVGTFQMTVAGESSGSARGYGIYVKVANLVHFQWYSGGMTISSATPTLSGLPFTATDPYAGASYPGFVAYHNTYVSNANSGYINLNTSIMYFTALNSTAGPSINTGASKYCMVAGTYHTH